jgi:hypothetical protein
MSDIKDVLNRALADGREGTPDPATPATAAAADLARGQRRLRRRRLAELGGGTVAVAAVAAVVAGLTVGGSPAARPAIAGGGAHHASTAHSRSGTTKGSTTKGSTAKGGKGITHAVALVAYTGHQVPGYQVSQVPSGWVVQGGNAYALTIAPQGDKDTSIDSFVCKIVVMLKSRDEPVPTHWQSFPVAGRTGYANDQDHTWSVIYQDSAGHWIDIQVPDSLGWSTSQLAQFAAGVQVLGNAQPGRG